MRNVLLAHRLVVSGLAVVVALTLSIYLIAAQTVFPDTGTRLANIEGTLGIVYPTATGEATATGVPPTATHEPTATNEPQPSTYQLVYSLSASRSNPQPLAGATLSGEVYIFTTPDTDDIERVTFDLDGRQVQRESNAPYDFAGGSAASANDWDSDDAGDGAHTITADIEFESGAGETVSATFSVDSGSTPPPTATPGDEPEPPPSATPDDNPDVSGLELIPTYASVSVYAPYSGTAENVLVEYRAIGGDWRRGHDLVVVDGQARGSLVDLAPGTAYEVRVGDAVETVTTWADAPPVGGGETIVVAAGESIEAAIGQAGPGDTVLVRGGEYGPFDVTSSGSADAYLDIRAYPGETPVVTTSGNGTLVTVAARYVRVSGFELVGGNNGVRVNSPSRYVVIDANTIHGLTYTGDTDGPVTLGDTFSSQNVVANITVQGNVIHAAPDDPAQSAIYVKGTSGGHVIRYNRIIFDHGGRDGVHGTDCIGGGPNFQDHGGLHRDSDVYGNYCEGATDDAISADGGGMNVRIWDNVSVGTQTGLSIAPVRMGPVYYFRNLTISQEVHWIDKCLGVKTGEDSSGTSFLYHNVWVSPDAGPCAGKIHGFSNDGGGQTGNVIFKNNIMQVTARIYSGSSVRGDYNLHFSDKSGGYSHPLYNCCGSSAGTLEEFQSDTGRDLHSIWGVAIFADAEYRLAAGSPGIDAGVVLPGFNDGYRGTAPDIGRWEH